MGLYSVKYKIINQKTKRQTGTSGTVISAEDVTEARYIFKCSHVNNTRIKYEISSVKNAPKAKIS